MPANFDESEWPVVLITMPTEEMTNDAFQEHLDRVSSLYDRGEPFGLIFDVRRASFLTPHQRRMVAAQNDRDALSHPGLMCGTAIVVASTLQRGIISVISWLGNQPYEMEAFSEIDHARNWLAPRIAAARAVRPAPDGQTGSF